MPGFIDLCKTFYDSVLLTIVQWIYLGFMKILFMALVVLIIFTSLICIINFLILLVLVLFGLQIFAARSMHQDHLINNTLRPSEVGFNDKPQDQQDTAPKTVDSTSEVVKYDNEYLKARRTHSINIADLDLSVDDRTHLRVPPRNDTQDGEFRHFD